MGKPRKQHRSAEIFRPSPVTAPSDRGVQTPRNFYQATVGFAVACVVWFLTISGARAELSIEDAIGIAVGNHPQLRARQAVIDRERGVLFQKSRKPNPIIGYSASEIGNDGQAGQQGVFLSQNFRRGGKIPLDMEIQRWEVSKVRAATELTHLQIEQAIGQQYVLTAAESRRLELLKRFESVVKSAEENTRVMYEIKDVSRSTLLQVELQRKRLAVQVQQQQRIVDGMLWKLGTMLGVEAAPDAVDANVLDQPAEPIDIETIWADICGRNPSLQMARAEHQRTLWVVQRANVEPIPDLQTQWTVQHDASTDTPVVGVQVGVEVPVHDKNRGARSAARADTRRTHNQILAIERQLRGKMADALRYYNAARQRLQANAELQTLANDNLKAMESAFKNLEASMLELLSAQRASVDIRLEMLDAQRNLALALVDIHTAFVK